MAIIKNIKAFSHYSRISNVDYQNEGLFGNGLSILI